MIDHKVKTVSEIHGAIKVYDGDEAVFVTGDERRARGFSEGYAKAKTYYIEKIVKWLEDNNAEVVWGGFPRHADLELRQAIEDGEL
jgi:hypothetical protein